MNPIIHQDAANSEWQTMKKYSTDNVSYKTFRPHGRVVFMFLIKISLFIERGAHLIVSFLPSLNLMF